MRRLSCVLVTLVVLVVLSAGAAQAQSVVLFEENFDGPTLDPLVWRTEDLTSGPRWCDPNAGSGEGPGSWINAGAGSCYGVPVVAPHGVATLESGLLTLATSGGRAFPYLCMRNFGGVSQFPVAGDFSITVRMRYHTRTGWGTGLVVEDWMNTEPSGGNAPYCRPRVVFQVWADPTAVMATSVSGTHQNTPIPAQDGWHEYLVRYEAGAYTFFVDGNLVWGPMPSALRPTAVWFGNPVFSYWGSTTWSGISIDYLRIEAFGPTAAARNSFGVLKTIYR